MLNNIENLIISGELLLPAEGKTYNALGDEVVSSNKLSEKITKVRLSHKTRKVMSTAEKLEKQIGKISQSCGDLQKNISKNAEKSRSNKFKSMRG